jgi:dihydrodipicolinate synthase/N-acetylneuraminate lyase
MRNHVEYVAASGIMGINVAGAGFGEGSLLTVDEVREIYGVTMEVGKGRLWCSAANIEHETAKDCIAWAGMAQAAGMDMVRIYPCDIGHTIVPTERMLEAFYREVLEAVDFMPVMMSSNIITGFEVPLEVHERLIDTYPQIVAFSKIHENVRNLTEFMLRIGPRIPVFTGNIGHVLVSVFLGGPGWHTPLANLVPRTCKRFLDAYQAGNRAEALELHRVLFRFEQGLNRHAREWSIRPVFMEAGRQLGLATGYPAPPYLPVEDAGTQRQIAALIDELELRRIEGL